MAITDAPRIVTSRLEYETKVGRLVRVSFSHSVVEILAEGRLTLPEYERAAAHGTGRHAADKACAVQGGSL